MAMQTDVKAAYVTAGSANAYAAAARVKGVYINASGAAALELTDGSATGASLLKLDVPTGATNNPVYVKIPGEGIFFPTSIYVKTLTNITSLTVFYG